VEKREAFVGVRREGKREKARRDTLRYFLTIASEQAATPNKRFSVLQGI